MTTTNGTRALQACVGARRILVGSLLNLGATLRQLEAEPIQNLVVVAAGTFEEAAYEDTLAAGAVCDALWHRFDESQIVDSARMARDIYCLHKTDLLAGLSHARNGRRLLEKPELRDDVAFAARLDAHGFASEFSGGAVAVSC